MTRTVILANLGTPAAPTPAAIRAFLAEFLRDPDVVDWPRALWLPVLHGIVLRRRPARIAPLYASIWTAEGAPLDAGTRRIAAALSARLGPGFAVEVAYRYGAPGLRGALEKAAARGGEAVLAILFPQRTAATTGTLERLARREAARAGIDGRLRVAIPDAADPGYVAALAERARGAFGGARPEHLLLSYHGIPARVARREGGLYEEDCARTSAALLAALDWPAAAATTAYQSRFGPERWLTPATDRVLAELPGRGVRSIAVLTPGFLTDGLETIEEIGIRGRESWEAAGGGRFERVPAVLDHPAWIDSLARLATDG